MAWIESHQALGNHPKTLRLAVTLGVDDPTAVGLLHYIWWWAVDYAPTGSLAEMSDPELARIARWKGDPAAFRAALRACRFLDPDDTLHDWDEYAGRLLEVRKRDAKRKREGRKKSDSRPADVRRPSTVPNIPNPTQPTQPTNQYPKEVRLGWFDALWSKYPSKDGRKAAERHFLATVLDKADLDRIEKALVNYLTSDRVRNGYVKNGSTWFNGWTDWVDYTEPPKGGGHGKTGNGFHADGANAEGDRGEAVTL